MKPSRVLCGPYRSDSAELAETTPAASSPLQRCRLGCCVLARWGQPLIAGYNVTNPDAADGGATMVWRLDPSNANDYLQESRGCWRVEPDGGNGT